MGFVLRLYSLSKKLNSTQQPLGDGVEYNCVLKDDCSITEPIIKLDIGIVSNPRIYNYAYIPDFRRYYYIDDWMFSDRLWVAKLRVDVLASNKIEIGNMVAYIKRSSAEFNPYVIDSFYPTISKFDVVRTENQSAYAFTNDIEHGFFVVGIISDKAGSFGSVQYYSMSANQFTQFANGLLSAITWADITPEEISENLQKALINPFQYVTSVKWFPFTPSGFTSEAVSIIKFGYWQVTATANLITGASSILKAFSFSVPEHPQFTRGAWLNCPPYSKRYVYIGGLGWKEINMTYPYTENIIINAEIDIFSGMAQFYLRENSYEAGDYTDMWTCKIGVDVPLSQIRQEVSIEGLQGGLMAQLPNAIGALFGVNQYDIAGGIGSIVNSAFPASVSTNGAGDSPYLYSIPPFMISIFTYVADEDNEHFGRPSCRNRIISEIPGFILVEHGDFENSNMFAKEVEQINNYLESGFYYE